MTEEWYAVESGNPYVNDTRPCPMCKEPRNRHDITGKLVNVDVWHKVWNGYGMSPSLAHTPVENVRTPLRPLIEGPVNGEIQEGTHEPQYRVGPRQGSL